MNTALIQDDVLMHLLQVIEDKYPIGPSFLHAINTVIEAAVLHDTNYFDAMGDHVISRDHPKDIWERVRSSSLIQQLRRAGVLSSFPNTDEVDAALRAFDSEYGWAHFMRDAAWTATGQSFANEEGERHFTSVHAELLTDFPGIFRTKYLTEEDNPIEPDAKKLIDMGMPLENLIDFEGLNCRTDGYLKISRCMRWNLYTAPTTIPYQLGAIRRTNTLARKIYEQVRGEIADLDADDIGSTDYQTIAMPELTRIVFRNAQGDLSALPDEIFRIRETHRPFRQYLTAYEQAWHTAKTKKERFDLQNDFDNAWQTLLKGEKRSKDRLIYKIWDILKKPTQIPQAIGDMLQSKGRELAVMSQVRGLHAFWQDLLAAPTAKENLNLLQSFARPLARKPLWDAATRLGRAIQVECDRTNRDGS